MSARWPCPCCGLRRRGPVLADPCLGVLPDVVFACCGHGTSEPNVTVIDPAKMPPFWVPGDFVLLELFKDIDIGLRRLRGDAALEHFRSHGVGPVSKDQLRLFTPPRRRRAS